VLTTNNMPELVALAAIPVVAVSATVILVTSLTVILRMTHQTDHLVRLYYTTVSASAFYELLGVMSRLQPTFGETLMCASLAMLMLFDRRGRSRHATCQNRSSHVSK